MFRGRTVFNDSSNIGCLYTMHDLSSPRMVTVDPLMFGAATGGDKVVLSGTVLIRGNGAATGQGRAFPGSYATAATATSANTITVRNASVFKIGDVLVSGLPTAPTALGTIASINFDTNVITLAANTTTAVVIGDPVYVNITTLAADLIGLCVVPHDITNDSNDIAGYLSASVYRDRLQFWNSAIAALLPEIKLCP